MTSICFFKPRMFDSIVINVSPQRENERNRGDLHTGWVSIQ